MTPHFYRMVMSGQPYPIVRWAQALGAPQYQFNSPVTFSHLTGIPLHRIQETYHEANHTPRGPAAGNGGAIRDP